MAKQTEEGPRVLADLTPNAPKWADLGQGIEVARDGEFLLVRMNVGAKALEKAAPSKAGALCMVAGGGMKWNKIDAFVGVDGAKLNLSLGVPNPTFDKVAAKKARLLRELKAAGFTAADLAA